MKVTALFPFLFGGTFIEGKKTPGAAAHRGHFPSFSEGLSLRVEAHNAALDALPDFPSFSEGLSLRGIAGVKLVRAKAYFPSFSEGLSLRVSFLLSTYY